MAATPRLVPRFTKTFVDSSANDGAKKQRMFWETALPGFGLRVGAKARTFFVQREVNGASKRRTVGRYGVLTVEEARAKARKMLDKMRDGIDPKAEQKRQAAEDATKGTTLSEAFALYKSAKTRDPRTVRDYDYALRTYLADWLDRPLASIALGEVHKRHQQIAIDVRKGCYAQKTKGKPRPNKGRTGETTADHVFHAFRAVYNRATKQNPDLPDNPVSNIDWFRPKRDPTPIPVGMLKRWYDGVGARASVQRDYLRFVLFTGLRRESAAVMERTHVDFEKRALYIPKPKGGKKRAFWLPLSGYLVDLLQKRIEGNDAALRMNLIPAHAAKWVWPAASASGHLVEPNPKVEGVHSEVEGAKGEIVRRHTSIHDLRRTFITFAESLDISTLAVKRLVNHSTGSDITARYVGKDFERLRAPMQQITDAMLTIVQGAATVTPLRKTA